MIRKLFHMAGMTAAGAVLASAVSSCTIETSGNGDLDGFWHLTRVDTLATGGSCDMSDELRFWAVQADLMNISDKGNTANGGYYGYLSHFEMNGTDLHLYDMYISDRMVGDVMLDDATPLHPFGINSLDEHYNVEHISSSEMILRTGELRLYFKKM